MSGKPRIDANRREWEVAPIRSGLPGVVSDSKSFPLFCVISRLRNSVAFVLTVLSVILSLPITLRADDSIKVVTELATEKAWMGEQVRFYVTLYSPGPFSGTPVFEIPEMGKTVISKEGSPVVGSSTEGGASWITQRHEFELYTQQVGTVEVPAFSVRFESKDSFVGEPVPRSGATGAVSFSSERPPGAEGLEFVVSSSTLKVEESWSAEDGAKLEAGDVVTRSITRTASDTSAMFLEPFVANPIEGVRIYSDDPEIDELGDRGVKRITRTDRIKYQFTTGGTFDLPAIRYAWWDPKEEEIQSVILDGRGYVATSPPVPPEPVDWKRISWVMIGVLVALAAAYRWVWPWGVRAYQAWHRRYHAPLAVAFRSLRKACRANNENGAYAALIAWKHAAGIEGAFKAPLSEPAEALGRRLFAAAEESGAWNGQELLEAFRQIESAHRSRRRAARPDDALPPLNPGWSADLGGRSS